MSRGELAEAVNDHLWSATGKRYALDAHAIARYERGQVRWPGAVYRAGLKAVLGAGSDSELGLHPTRRGSSTVGSREDAAAAMEGAAPSKLRADPPRAVQLGDVAAIRHMLDALTVSDRRFGGGHLREHAVDYFVRLVRPRLQARADERTRKELLTCSTEFALRVASMELDAGRVAQSRTLIGMAARLAHESDDLTLEAWAMARRGEQEIHEAMLAAQRGQHPGWKGGVQRAVACAGAAAALAGGAPPAARAFILVKHALAVSMTGDHAEVERILAQVWRQYEQFGSVEEPAWMKAYEWSNLRHEEGRCYANLGAGDAAARAARECLQVRSDTRPKAFTVGILALGRARAGEIDGACDAGRELVVLAQAVASQRVRVRLSEVLAALRPHRTVAEVRDLHEVARPIVQGVDGG